jgi:hypothetical protein
VSGPARHQVEEPQLQARVVHQDAPTTEPLEPTSRRAPTRSSILRLQRAAGNRAVTRDLLTVQLLSENAGYFNQAVAGSLWSNAALRLNGLSDGEITAVLKKLSLVQLRFLREALVKDLAGWGRQPALLTSVDAQMAKAGKGKSQRQILLDAINALIAEKRWGDAVVKMHGLNEPDVKAFVKQRSSAVVWDLAVAANTLGWDTYVKAALTTATGPHAKAAKVHGDFDRALAQRNFEELSLTLNAMSPPDLEAHLRRIPVASLSQVTAAAAVAMPGWPPVVADAILNLRTGASTTILDREKIRGLARTAGIADVRILFDHRFRIPLEGDWTKPALLASWDQLDLLPDNQVTPAIVKKLQGIMGDGGSENSQTIKIGQELAGLGHAVRHEVAHALQSAGSVNPNPFLATYWTAPGGLSVLKGNPSTELQAVITAHGGYKPGTTAAQQSAGLAALVTYFAAFNGFASGPSGSLPKAATSVLRKATVASFRLSGLHFWENYLSIPPSADGRRWFYNPYYSRALAFNGPAMGIIGITGDAYTAMSDLEFFANTYAKYFENPTPSKWGTGLPASVKTWFKTNVVPTLATAFAGGATPPRKKNTPK